MIKHIRLKYFQGYKDSTFEFTPGINTIIGVTQSGKTSLPRAIDLVNRNRPFGFQYNHNYSDNNATEVEIGTVEGDVVSIEKSKTNNNSVSTIYKANGERFKGKVVPDMVSSILNLGDLNYQNQLEARKLSLSTPGDIAKIINKAVKAEQSHMMIKAANSKIDSMKAECKVHKKDIERDEARLVDFEGLDQVSVMIADAEELSDEKVKLIDELQSISELIEDWYDSDEDEHRYSDLPKIQKSIGRLEFKIDNYKTLSADKNSLDELVNEHNKASSASDIKVDTISKLISDAEEIIDSIDNLEEIGDELCNLFDAIDRVDETSGKSANASGKLKDELLKLGKCPFCDTKITKKKALEVIRKYEVC